MVARNYSRTTIQKGGKVGTFKKFTTKLGAVPHYTKQGVKGTAIGISGLVATPIVTGISIAKAATVGATTAAISAPTRAIQGSIKTPWQLAKLGVQKLIERRARSKLAAAGLHNYENLQQRVSKRKSTVNTLRAQKAKLNANKLAQNIQGRSSRLSSWWKNKQIASKESAIKKAEARLSQSLTRKGERTYTAIASETENISGKAEKFIKGLNTSKKRQMEAYDASLTKQRAEKVAPINSKISELGNTHPTRKSHTETQRKKENASKELTQSQNLLKQFTLLQPTSFVNGKVKIGEQEYTRDEAIAKAKALRGTIKTQTAELDVATRELNKSAKAVEALDAEVAKLKEQKNKYMAQGKTAEQLYGSFKRRQAIVQQTKKDLGKSVQQLTGISTIKNIGRATKASFQQDLGLAQKAIKTATGTQLGTKQLNTSFGTLAKSVGKSLTSSQKNLSSRYTTIKEGVSPLGLKIKTLWRGYVSKFSKQGKLLNKMNEDTNAKGKLANEAAAITEKYKNLQPGELIPPALRERHQALINKRQIMKTFANLIAKNRSTTPDPNKSIDESSTVGKGAKTLDIKLPLTDMRQLEEHIKKAENALKTAKDYPSKMQYLGLYDHLKSIKRWNDSNDFETKTNELVGKLNKLLPGELEVLPEFKPKPAAKDNSTSSATPHPKSVKSNSRQRKEKKIAYLISKLEEIKKLNPSTLRETNKISKRLDKYEKMFNDILGKS